MPEWEYDDGATWGWPDDRTSGARDEPGFATPAEAAAPEIPARYVTVRSVKLSDDGRHAVVELVTNEEPYLYPYTVFCERDSAGRWHEAGGHN